MLSTIQKEIQYIDGIYHLKPKQYPDYCGLSDIGFIYKNCWDEPVLEYKGQVFGSSMVEDTMWEMFLEDGGNESDDKAFTLYVQENKDEVYALLNEEIDRRCKGGYKMEDA